ncbi:cytochrome P450 [Saccharothrix sp. S26]|uniref:cytochrome P450 n=1 Tax=Saccharothrix sp. S26 TaxID=2907215 RepID=UPI001F40186A|nr:cytochrome P450 [Saccharothrix sp. S26]MCE6994961.1 cytochrome P450 [Saccharothrix sp. S26]
MIGSARTTVLRWSAAARSGDGIVEVEPGVWLVTDPGETERLLASRDATTARTGGRTPPTSWGPDGLATWMAVRSAMRPVLAVPGIAAAADQARRIVAGTPAPGEVDAVALSVRLVSAVTARHLLGEPSDVLPPLVERELVLAGRARSPLGRLRLRHAQRATRTAILAHVRNTSSPDGLPAVLAERGFDEHTVTSAVRTMLLSGHHVPATALAWALHELATHPDVQRDARAEALAHAGPTADLPLCRAVLRETLRLHPPVWRLRRRLVAPVRDLPAGADLLFSPYLNHRAPDRWSEPSRFRPRRWTGDFRPAPGTYLPFALGPRTCPAARPALAQLTVVLAAVLRAHHLDPHRAPVPTFDVLHAPRRLRLRLRPVAAEPRT